MKPKTIILALVFVAAVVVCYMAVYAIVSWMIAAGR